MKFENYLINEGINDKGIFKAMFMAGFPGCFSGNTEIKTLKGYKFIKDINIGDLIYTLNEKTKEIEIKPVENVLSYSKYDNDIIELEFDNGQKVICTENHEFYIDGKWIKAKDL